MKVPFFRSPWQEAGSAAPVMAAWSRVLNSGQYVLGPSVERFEQALGRRLGQEAVVGVNSGTDALALALRLLDLRPGDEVVLPSYTFFACWEAVVRAGATPVLCDTAPDDFLARSTQVEACLTPRTRAVLAVPLFGDASALPELASLCRDRGLTMVEDAAQALGAQARDVEGNGRWVPAGAWGHLSALSFYPTKNLGATGDAGALTGRTSDWVSRARSLRNHGWREGGHAETGWNSRLDALQAEVLLQGLEQLDTWLASRRAVARYYLEGLSDVPGVILPTDCEGHAWNYFVLRCNQRDALRERLGRLGVETKIYYENAIHQQPAVVTRLGSLDLPHASHHARTALALPMFPGLSACELERVVGAVRQAAREQRVE